MRVSLHQSMLRMTMLLAAVLTGCTGNNPNQVLSTSASAASVPAPDYGLAVDELTIQTDVHDVVQSASGGARLTAGTVTGQTYVVANATDLTYGELDTAYLAGTEAPLTTMIVAAKFSLVGADLTASQVRTLIIANTDEVRSYQAFAITFDPAP